MLLIVLPCHKSFAARNLALDSFVAAKLQMQVKVIPEIEMGYYFKFQYNKEL